MTGEQQEAVCGTCGVYRARIDKSCPRCGAEFAPAPVVPSEPVADALMTTDRCELCGRDGARERRFEFFGSATYEAHICARCDKPDAPTHLLEHLTGYP